MTENENTPSTWIFDITEYERAIFYQSTEDPKLREEIRFMAAKKSEPALDNNTEPHLYTPDTHRMPKLQQSEQNFPVPQLAQSQAIRFTKKLTGKTVFSLLPLRILSYVLSASNLDLTAKTTPMPKPSHHRELWSMTKTKTHSSICIARTGSTSRYREVGDLLCVISWHLFRGMMSRMR